MFSPIDFQCKLLFIFTNWTDNRQQAANAAHRDQISASHLGFQGRTGGRRGLWGRQTGSSSVACVLSRSVARCSDGGRVSSRKIRSRYMSLAEEYPAKSNLISNHSIINIICTMDLQQVQMSQGVVYVCELWECYCKHKFCLFSQNE